MYRNILNILQDRVNYKECAPITNKVCYLKGLEFFHCTLFNEKSETKSFGCLSLLGLSLTDQSVYLLKPEQVVFYPAADVKSNCCS